MAQLQMIVLTFCLACGVIGQPHINSDEMATAAAAEVSLTAATAVTGRPRLWRRFVNPALTAGKFSDAGLPKMRMKRSAGSCQKLKLCQLHAGSGRNFVSAFQLYFVSKENAKYWDHNDARTMADCERLYGDGCHGNAPTPAPATRQRQFRFLDDDDYYR